jgi:hypothetical protein
MMTLLDGWSHPLDDAARRLLQHANDYVQPGTASTSIIPILLAALTTPNTATYSILKETADRAGGGSFIPYIESKLDDTAYIDDLEIYKQACMEVAREEHIRISDVLILWQIFEKNLPASRLFQSYGIDTHELQNVLQEEMGLGQTHTSTSSSQAVREAIPPLAIPEIWRHITSIVLTDRVLKNKLEKIDPYMHSVTQGHLMGVLEHIMSTQNNRVVLFAGANGSVADVFKYMLAYWIGQSKASIPENPHIPEQLRGYELWEISIDYFRNFSRRRRIAFEVLLEYLKDESVQRRAIVLLTGFESIRRDSSVWRRVRDMLANPRGACIICSHIYEGAKPLDHDLTLGSSNMIPVHAERKDTKSLVYDFIDDYHQPRWKAGGYTIADDTFDSLFVLEPGIWISHRRKTWPYLGVDLVDDCIGTAKRGSRAIRNVARDAREAINDVLTRETLFVSDTTREQFSDTLEAVRSHIELLCQDSTLPLQNDLTVVTQALVEAQLFCRNNSEFHYPGVRLW